jgi:serine/threonine protein kinase
VSSTRVCPQCGTRYEGEQRFCSLDGATLIAEQQSDTLTGSVLADRYLVREKLGEGGMGEVYLAEHIRMKRKVAVKVMRKWLTSDPAAIGRFHREAENASQISHPNVAAVYDFGETSDGLVYLAMEFVAGESLTHVLERERILNHMRASDVVSQIADALASAHSLGILHRDLKPDNVMIGRTRVGTDLVKLLDFGIARVMGRETQHFTSTGLIIGTPDWMAPEQISGDQMDARADIYALGLIAFRMLTGEGAFGNASSQDTLLAKMTKSPRRLSEVLPDLAWPEALQSTLDRVLAPDPADRYTDALAFASDFYYAVSQLPMTTDAEAYLSALSQRAVTPSRGASSVEPTPPRPFAGFTDSGASSGVSAAFGSGGRTVSGETARAVTPAVPQPATEEATARTPVELSDSAESPRSGETATASTTSGEVGPMYGGAAAAPRTGETPRRRWSPRLVGAAAGAVVLIAIVAVWSWGSGKAPTGNKAPAAARTDSALVVSDAKPDSSSARALEGVRATGVLALDSVRKRSERSVFRVSGRSGAGLAGFLADSQGIVLTSAAVFGARGDTVTVMVDGSKRLWGRVLDNDPKSGLAAVVISMKLCGRCSVLALAADSSTRAKASDSVVIVGGPSLTNARATTRGTVVAGEEAGGRLTTNARAGMAQMGGPVLLANGRVAGVARSNSSSGLLVAGAGAAKTFLSAAMASLGKVKAIDSLPPTWPSRPVELEALREGERRSPAQIDRFRLPDKDEYSVLIMTPQVVAWRKHFADSLRGHPSLIGNYCHKEENCDSIEWWLKWNEYVTERRAVVIVQISPKVAPAPQIGRPPTKLTFRGRKFGSLELVRDNVPATPIEAARIHAVTNPGDYSPDQQFNSGIYVFTASDFVGGRVELRIYDESPKPKQTTIGISKDVLAAINADLAAYATPR